MSRLLTLELSDRLNRLPTSRATLQSMEGRESSGTGHNLLAWRKLSARPVFLAEAVLNRTPNLVKCVVKFTERYSKEGHEVMAATGVAAELLYYEWEVTKILRSQGTDGGEGLAAIHREELAHGDVREAGHTWLIDF